VGPLPPPAGGMANQTRQLEELLRAEGLEVRLVRTNAPCRPAWLEQLRGVRGIARLLPYLGQLRALARESEVMHVMANSGWAWSLCAAPAIRAAIRGCIPVIVNYRGGFAREFLAQSAARVVPLLRQADEVVVPSRFLQQVFAGYDVACCIIPNVVNVETFRPSSDASGATSQHIVVTRNLEAIYGIDVALRAVALLAREFPQLRLSIAGTGPERNALERLAGELGIADRVRFTGRLDVQAVAQLYRDAAIALNSSRVDNTPNSVLEAAATGIPIVSTDVGGVPYLLEHERTALLVPPDDPACMAAALTRLLRDPSLRSELTSNATRLAQSCSWAVIRQQWLDLYSRLARARGTAAVSVGVR
jgi:glycosyltransferase involved in cell wall biosynthesis